MSHVVIIGAGTGGVPAAYDIRQQLSDEHQVTLINASEKFQFVPSNPWIAVGWREADDITVALEPPLTKRNIDFIAQSVERIEPDEDRITLADGETVDYDYLVIATGPKLAFEEIPGLGPEGHTQSICTLKHALQAHDAYQQFLRNPGPIVVGAAQGASCFGPAYEFSLILDADLRKRKLRDKVPMTFITSEPYIGHMGLGGVGDSKGIMESELRQHHIKWFTNAAINSVEPGGIITGVRLHWQGSDVIDYPSEPPPFEFDWRLYGPYSEDDIKVIRDSFQDSVYVTNDGGVPLQFTTAEPQVLQH